MLFKIEGCIYLKGSVYFGKFIYLYVCVYFFGNIIIIFFYIVIVKNLFLLIFFEC